MDGFKAKPKIAIRKTGFKDVYLGSVELTKWLQKEGLVYNKVSSRVDMPRWIYKEKQFMQSFLRGFFDTDGSVYKLKFGIQVAFNNKSRPLLLSTHKVLQNLGYNTSKISRYKIYLTKRKDVERFFREIKPANLKHRERFKVFWNQLRAGRPVGGGG